MDVIIRASEIGQYTFCHRAWWLATMQGYETENKAALNAGTRSHLRHGRTVAVSQRWQRIGYGLLLLGAVLAAIALCGLLGGSW